MSESVAPVPSRTLSRRWILALLPLLALIAAAVLVWSRGGSVIDLVGTTPPSIDAVEVRRVEFRPDEIRVLVRNPQREAITIASVAVDDAIVPFSVNGDAQLGRLRSATIVVPFDWIADDPYTIGVTSSTGIETVANVPAAVLSTRLSVRSFLGFGLIGLLVGLVPVALGLGWLPALRTLTPATLAGILALTVGMLTFLSVDALGEALSLQATLPSAVGGPGLVLLGAAGAVVGLLWLARRRSGSKPAAGTFDSLRLATLVAVGIGLHNLGEGLAIGSSFAIGELALGTSLILGFMVHNLTEGLGIAAPVAGRPIGVRRALGLAAIAGLPTVAGTWIGGFLASDEIAVAFLAIGAGAAIAVVIELLRGLRKRLPGGLISGPTSAGFVTGLALMYITGLFVA